MSISSRDLGLGLEESSLASTLPTLPAGGWTLLCSASPSYTISTAGVWAGCFIGLYRAAASLAAMLEGDVPGSGRPSSGTASVLELLEWLNAGGGTADVLVLPPVQFLRSGEVLPDGVCARGVPVPTLAAARRAPLFPPVYVFGCGFGFKGGLKKAEDAPRRAALCTLYWVSPGACGTCGLLRALVELIESPSAWEGCGLGGERGEDARRRRNDPRRDSEKGRLAWRENE